MKYFRHWAIITSMVTRKGKDFSVSIKGHSNVSYDDAVRNAEMKKGAIVSAIIDDTYETEGDVLVEEVVSELEGASKPVIITRNRYGCLVLNAADIIITDHDLKSAYKFSPLNFFPFSLFRTRVNDKSELLKSIRTGLEKNNLHARIYETKNGYRCIVTSRFVSGGNDESIKILEKLGCDPLYVRMTNVQKCYRTRLTPKPFRMKLPKPPVKFPFPTEKAGEYFNEWLAEYDAVSTRYAACRFIEAVGPAGDSRVMKIVGMHDEMTKCKSGLPLA
jgi:hypothetical protein